MTLGKPRIGCNSFLFTKLFLRLYNKMFVSVKILPQHACLNSFRDDHYMLTQDHNSNKHANSRVSVYEDQKQKPSCLSFPFRRFAHKTCLVQKCIKQPSFSTFKPSFFMSSARSSQSSLQKDNCSSALLSSLNVLYI